MGDARELAKESSVTSTTHTATATVYGYPRQGRDRELKRAIEAYWAGESSDNELLTAAARLRQQRWAELSDAGLGELPSNDFSLYDHVLDTAVILGAIPARHRDAVPDVSTARGALDRYFSMARGSADVAPMEMTKWFDTNYHYLVPELGPDQQFLLDETKPLREFVTALLLGASATASGLRVALDLSARHVDPEHRGCRGPHVDRQVSPAAGVSAAEHPRGSVCANWPLAFIDARENTQ
jgi:Cobalamin-independent synthase, N-terminal domain